MTETDWYFCTPELEFFNSELQNCIFSGDTALEKFYTLMGRVKSKRLKTVARLLKGVREFGCRVEFDSAEDPDCDNIFEENKDCGGVFTEIDHWIHLNLDLIHSWKSVEQILAHEAVHLCQNVVFKGDRTGDSSMEISMDRIWSCYDSSKYRKWLEDVSEEDFPCYEAEAYSEMDRPKGVACSLEFMKSKFNLWEGTYYCPVNW